MFRALKSIIKKKEISDKMGYVELAIEEVDRRSINMLW